MLRYVEDLRTLFFLSLCIIIYKHYWNHFYNKFLFIVVSLQSFQMSVIVHNCAHTHPFKYKFLNNVFFILLTLVSGSPTSLYVPGHNESHHLHLETEKDMMCTTQMQYDSEFLNLVLFAPSIISKILKNERIYMFEQYKKRSRLFYRYFMESIVYFSFIAFLSYYNLKKTFFVYLLPTVLGKYMIISLNMLQHYKCDPLSKYNHSRNFTGFLLNYFFLNNGFHTAHHISPGTHWSLLPKKHKTIEKNIHPSLVKSNILLYIYEHHFPGLIYSNGFCVEKQAL